MIALIQRVKTARVEVEGEVISEISKGYLILLGVLEDDNEEDAKKLARKIAFLRIMSDDKGKMNKDVKEARGEILVVSQFTLAADLSRGRRPSFVKAKNPKEAKELYESFVNELKNYQIPVKTGRFGEYMQVYLQNDGPVTIIADSKKL